MKLAEALAERAALNRQLASLRDRAVNSVASYEGDSPKGDFDTIHRDYQQASARYETLVTAINHANSHVEIEPGVTFSAAIAQRDRLGGEIAFLEATLRSAEHEPSYSRRETARIIHVDLDELRRQIAALSAERRRIDNKLQHAGWNTDITI